MADKYIQTSVRDIKLFLKDTTRIINISKAKGIKATIGKLEKFPNGATKIASYKFNREQWTPEEAKAWIKARGKAIEALYDANIPFTYEDKRFNILAKEGKVMRKAIFHAEIKEVDDSEDEFGYILGYASTKTLDRMNEIVESGAFDESLKTYERNPIITYMHDWDNPIGKAIKLEVNSKGLKIKAAIDKESKDIKGNNIWRRIKLGILKTFSIGYDIKEADRDDDGVGHLRKLELYEIGVVSIPANTTCEFSLAKALEFGSDLICNDEGVCIPKEEAKEIDKSLDIKAEKEAEQKARKKKAYEVRLQSETKKLKIQIAILKEKADSL